MNHIPAPVRAALDRMSTPLDESRLPGVTAQMDAECMAIIRAHIEGAAPAQPAATSIDTQAFWDCVMAYCRGVGSEGKALVEFVNEWGNQRYFDGLLIGDAPPAADVSSPTDERAAFEAAARKGLAPAISGFDFQRNDDDEYKWFATRRLYEFWQAARAAAPVSGTDEKAGDLSPLREFADAVKSLCNDYSSRNGSVYISDVCGCIDALHDQYATHEASSAAPVSGASQMLQRIEDLVEKAHMPRDQAARLAADERFGDLIAKMDSNGCQLAVDDDGETWVRNIRAERAEALLASQNCASIDTNEFQLLLLACCKSFPLDQGPHQYQDDRKALVAFIDSRRAAPKLLAALQKLTGPTVAASASDLPEVAHSARMMMAFYQGAEFSAAPVSGPSDDGPEFTVDDPDLDALLNLAADMAKGIGNMDSGMLFLSILEKVESRLLPISAAPVSGQGAITRWSVRYAEWKDDTSMTDQEKRTRCMLDEIANLRAALDSHPRSEDSRAKVLEEAAKLCDEEAEQWPIEEGWQAARDCATSSERHVRYSEPLPRRPGRRRRCYCGCGNPVTHAGKANGIALTCACAMGIARWVRTGDAKPAKGIDHGK